MSILSTVRHSTMEVPLAMPIVEEAPKVVSQPIPINPTRKKKMTSPVILPEKILKETHDAQDSGSHSTTILFGYIPT